MLSKIIIRAAFLSAIVGLAMPSTTQAAAFTWNFNSPSGAVATPHSYLDNSSIYTITAYGYVTANNGPANPTVGQTWGNGGGFTYNTGAINAINLYGKNSTPPETGLGLDGLDSDHEIQVNSFIQLDILNLLNNGFINMTVFIGSVQTSEGYALWGSNVLGTPGTLLFNGGNPSTGGELQSFVVPQFGTYRYLSVGSRSVDILIANGLVANTPEPAAAGLLIAAAAALHRRRSRA